MPIYEISKQPKYNLANYLNLSFENRTRPFLLYRNKTEL